MTTCYARQGHCVMIGERGKVFCPHAEDRIRIGEEVAIIDSFDEGGECVAFGDVLDVFENGYTIRVKTISAHRKDK